VKLLPVRRLVPAQPPTGQTLGRGADFALVVLVFLGIGWAIDRWLGTWPGFAIGMVIFSVVGQFVKMYYEYTASMERLEAERRERAATRTAARPTTVAVDDDRTSA